MKKYNDFEIELLEDSKQNIIYRLYFAEKQLEQIRKKRNELEVENQALKIALQAFGNKVMEV